METVEIGIREFRENLAKYLLGRSSVAITRHGETIGYFIPARRKLTEEQKAAFDRAAARLDAALAAAGVTEDELVEEFKQLRKKKDK